jgi:hypothetical protein
MRHRGVEVKAPHLEALVLGYKLDLRTMQRDVSEV